jgi:hypothetical protein
MELVLGAERLTQVFGYWPSFNDAEVVRVVMDRRGPSGPTLEFAIHVHETTADLDAAGCFVRKNHSLATLLFRGVTLRELKWFNHQNVLSELWLMPLDPAQHEGRCISVEMTSLWGMEAYFECVECELTKVEPWEPAPVSES